MSRPKLPKPQRVTFSRAFERGRSLRTLLVGSSRILRDVELILEDHWRNLAIATSNDEMDRLIASIRPSVALIEWDAFEGAVDRLLETSLKVVSKRIVLITQETTAQTRRHLEHRALLYDYSIFEISSDSKPAAQSIDGMLKSLVDLGVGRPSDLFNRVQTATSGFFAGINYARNPAYQREAASLVILSRLLFSKLALDVEQLEAATLLAESYDFWLASRQCPNEMSASFDELEEICTTSGVPTMALLELADAVRNHLHGFKIPTAMQWSRLINSRHFDPILARHLVGLYPQVAVLCREVVAVDDEFKSLLRPA